MVTKAGKVDFFCARGLAQCSLNGKNNFHQGMLLRRCEVGHLAHVPVENDATEPRIVKVLDENNSTECIAPEEQSSVAGA